MQIADIFKSTYSESCEQTPAVNGNNGNTRKDLFFAISASLAMHIGIVIILTTATAMSFSLKLWEDPVLHVSLVAMTEGQKSDIKDLSEVTRPKKESVEPQVVIKPVEKEDRAKATVEPATPRFVEVQTMKNSVVAVSQPSGSGVKTAPAELYDNHDNKGRSDSLAGNSFTGISLAVPRYRENVHPAYPRIARMRGYEGVVLISAEISVYGRVEDLKIKRTSGYSVLDRSALEAVKTWKFEPGRKMGKPTDMWVDVPVKFVLSDNEQM